MAAPVIHFEIGCKNAGKTVTFYSELLGWTTEAYGPAHMVDTGSKEGIRGHIQSLGHEPHNYVVLYAQVDQLEPYIERAKKLGGKLMIPPQEVPGMGHFAWITDPEGTIFGLWKAMKA